ncbi:MAG TPA: 16S rRNA (adenine(1518)-N(6)/adenine(1519)-N(6))-dimethyltransferase RsmA, partial [Candidatus Deferrimicrobiaceae bacterium]|nr:16S rRNA (adenine(1518)-N(6)/adenine(1519)-N(6))-dimethyltransferase RsmA [Candidatus Deferrimicrobiaceae bacterium]
RKIVAVARGMGPPFLEIGPGLGSLTGILASEGFSTVAVEVDRTLADYLRGRFERSSIAVLEADFLAVPEAEWRKRFPTGGTVIGNLPYSLSSPIVLRLLDLREAFPRAVLMLQKEMVERLCALPGGKEYGTLSVYFAVLAVSRLEFLVRRTCFTPSPEVDSAVVSIRFRPGIPEPLVRNLQTVVRAAFARRRKKLKNAPVPFFLGGTEEWCDLLSRAGVDPSARAETVPPGTYLELARFLPPGEEGAGR